MKKEKNTQKQTIYKIFSSDITHSGDYRYEALAIADYRSPRNAAQRNAQP